MANDKNSFMGNAKMAKLRPRARIIRTIGDQLVSGPAAAIIELVKNAYDADSDVVEIKIIPKSEDKKKRSGSITIVDRGHGMSYSDIQEKWFEPATTEKLLRRVSPGGRLLLGAKGVGRFATARLGDRLALKSVITGTKLGRTTVEVDWNVFEQSKYLDEIELQIARADASPSETQGVSLTITQLRDDWTKKELEQLVKELRRLISPIAKSKDPFRIFLDLSSFTEVTNGFDGQALVAGTLHVVDGDLDKSVDPREIHPVRFEKLHHYLVKGIFSKDGAFEGNFTNFRGDGKRIRIEIPAASIADHELSCGEFKLQLNIFDREGDAIVELLETAGFAGIRKLDARKLLDENIGIGIYRNRFRIRPYGDAQTDWLELERKRVQNPSHNLGLNQVWGTVFIGDEKSSNLIERSSREGLEHNGAFVRLKNLVAALLARVEALRVDSRQKAGRSRKPTASPDLVKGAARLEAIRIATRRYVPKEYQKQFEKAIEFDTLKLDTAIQDLETYHQSLASVSSLGLVVTHTVHEGRRFLSNVVTRSTRIAKGAPRLLEKSDFGDHYRTAFAADAESVLDSARSLNKHFKALDPITGKKRGPPKRFDIRGIVENCKQLLDPQLIESNVDISFIGFEAAVFVRGYEGDLMAATLNVLDNAIHWLATNSTQNRQIIVSLRKVRTFAQLAISNNGPLIDENFYDRLFEPGFSLKTEGSGLGLAIAREAIRASKGDIAFTGDSGTTRFSIEMQLD
jgi:signal transduction histidine kinase